jgi:redox-sensitive bicupin YhaK (pirin superfamily)
MTGPRAVLRTADLPVDRPGQGFDRGISVNAATIGADLSPFVDLTEFDMSQPVFRPHPHAGFSAVTYMFEDSPGTFMNRWSKGDPMTIPPGSLHWTQAGAGMMHEEIPTEPGVTCHGLQMFVKLAAADELSEPEAFHLDPDEIVELTPAPGARIRLLAGSLHGASAGIGIRNDISFADVHLEPGVTVTLSAPAGTNAFIFVREGVVTSQATTVHAGAAAVFAHDGGDYIELSASTRAALLFGAGRPLGEALHQAGPFMMSSMERLQGAFEAYERGDMGRLAPSF